MDDHDEVVDDPHRAVGSGLVPAGATGPDMTALASELVASASERDIALTGEGGLLTALTKQVLQSALEAELAALLGYDKHDPVGRNGGNSRNGSTPKTVRTDRSRSNWAWTAVASGWSYTLCSIALTAGHIDFGVTPSRLKA